MGQRFEPKKLNGGRWAIVNQDGERGSVTFPTKRQAVAWIAYRRSAEVAFAEVIAEIEAGREVAEGRVG